MPSDKVVREIELSFEYEDITVELKPSEKFAKFVVEYSFIDADYNPMVCKNYFDSYEKAYKNYIEILDIVSKIIGKKYVLRNSNISRAYDNKIKNEICVLKRSLENF